MTAKSDIGPLLRSTRSTFGWSLEDVAHRTRIPVATLRHLENNEFSSFPSSAYAKSFLAQYGEHLGLDATEWLDDFECDDTLANLDRHEYLKDHQERVSASPLVSKRPKPKKPKEPKTPKAAKTIARPRSAAMPPLYIFLVTAALVSGVVVGFMKLSANWSEDAANTERTLPVEEQLRPVIGIPPGRPNFRDLSTVPRALPVTSEDTLMAGVPSIVRGADQLNSTSTTQVSAVPTKISPNTPPPRAVIVEE